MEEDQKELAKDFFLGLGVILLTVIFFRALLQWFLGISVLKKQIRNINLNVEKLVRSNM